MNAIFTLFIRFINNAVIHYTNTFPGNKKTKYTLPVVMLVADANSTQS